MAPPANIADPERAGLGCALSAHVPRHNRTQAAHRQRRHKRR